MPRYYKYIIQIILQMGIDMLIIAQVIWPSCQLEIWYAKILYIVANENSHRAILSIYHTDKAF